jgi:hypothetical protein
MLEYGTKIRSIKRAYLGIIIMVKLIIILIKPLFVIRLICG